MKLCFLGIHEWYQWQLERALYSHYYIVDDEKICDYKFRYQKRQCKNCGITQSKKVKVGE